MDIKKAIETLEDHQKWRKKDFDSRTINPLQVGIALDTVIKYCKGKEGIKDGKDN